MSIYLWIKLIHIVSAAVLFGTGVGIAFFMLKAYLGRNEDTMLFTVRSVVVADWLFTSPAVLVQFATGLWLTEKLGIAYNSAWFISVIGLFAVVGACWLPVVRIQIRIRELVSKGANRSEYKKLMWAWGALGVPAFICILMIFYLMVSKAGL
jgi:uncharacterized membrane protein